MTFEEVIEALQPYKRTAYIPQAKEVKSEFSAHSKIGGFPYLRNAEDWPVCPSCNKHMQLFLQLNLAELPAQASEGLLQLFYCTNDEPLCEDELEAYFPFSKATCCRKVDLGGASAQTSPTMENPFPEKRILDWEAKDDYPHFEEYDDLDIDLDVEDEVYEEMESSGKGWALAGDKLFGWPHWIQGVEYPDDRTTGSTMGLVFQLDSEINLPHMFGDAGVGHLTQSPDNADELSFGWACG